MPPHGPEPHDPRQHAARQRPFPVAFLRLCLPPLFIAWQSAFGVSFAELGLAVALMSGASAVFQTPVGFLVDRYGARRFLIGGALLMSL